MSTCARCGLPFFSEQVAVTKPATVFCMSNQHESWEDVLNCRNRELANLRSLLRSVTGKLEKAHERLEHVTTLEVGPRSANAELETLLRELDSVLELLS